MRPAVLVEEDVDAFVEAHQRDRDRAVADREDDRIMALHERELVDRHRDRVGLRRPAASRSIARTFILPCCVDVQRLDRIVEQGQALVRGGSRHLKIFSWGLGLTAAHARAARRINCERASIGLRGVRQAGTRQRSAPAAAVH